MRSAVVSLLLALLVSGCGVASTSPPRPPVDSGSSGASSDIEGEWWFVSGHGPEGGTPRFPETITTLEIEKGNISGTAVCNHYQGPVEIDGTSFDAQGIGMTEMGCLPRSKMAAEYNFIAALDDADTIVVEGKRLTLTGPNSELVFKLHEPPPTPELAGTRWKLNGLVVGRGSYGSVSSVEPGFLVLKSSGTLVGHSGCRRFEGQWTASGDRVDVTGFELIGACDGDTEQDEHVRTVLSSGFTYKIREQSLQLYQLDGDLGLDYTTGLR